VDLRLVAQLSRFEASDDGAVQLEGSWALRSGEDGSGIGEGRLSIREPLEGEGTEAVVAAMSRALGEMSRRIAEVLARDAPEP
jgi:uncharacterized lipoprotein YmbA